MDGVLTTPKNHQRRRVDMSEQLAGELVLLRRQQREQALAAGVPAPEVVFCSSTGTMLDEANVRHVFYRILEQAQLRRIRFHDLGHTFASLLIQQGESLAYVRDQLGHKSIQITCDVYGHLVPGGNRAAVDRLDDATICNPGATSDLSDFAAEEAKLLKVNGDPHFHELEPDHPVPPATRPTPFRRVSPAVGRTTSTASGFRDVQAGTARPQGHGHNGFMAKMISAVNLALALTILLPGVSQAQTLPASVMPDFHVLIIGSEAYDFTARVNRYFELRSRLERGLPAVIVTDDVGAIRRGTRALARAIRLARPGAVQGEFFTIATGVYMKRELAVVVNTTVWAVIMDENPGAFRHDIDGAYPEGKPRSTMPGIVLAQLPPLPDGIEFRFIGPHLILYDTRANTIIDRLPDAIQCEDRCAD